MKTHITLSIAGSDSSGGAGIQADIKAISATGGYACTAITALTAQNTQGVLGVLPIPIAFIESQLDAVFTDLSVQAVKIGMLANKDVIAVVARKLRQYCPPWVVLDPVMIATSGDVLLHRDAIDALIHELLPLADLVTPNLPEAAALLGGEIPTTFAAVQQMVSGCRQLSAASSGQGKTPLFLLKGGHLINDEFSRDLLVSQTEVQQFCAPRIITKNTHGTGCTLSSAIASYLAQGIEMSHAVDKAKRYLTQALSHADDVNVGHGHGPVAHFYMLADCAE